ncbi:MAG: type II toxin-antitoxin system RelE/ParE family toxin [Gemmatimonadetes bacterium]|nr:type II toxin-antitoxin system RelE/ParE family toxin [Gemmatimonadota bacterium]
MSSGARHLKFTKSAAKGIRDLPEHTREACKKMLRELVTGETQGKKLKGELKAFRSIRLGRSHRLLYLETKVEILVVAVGPRGDVYKG